MTTVSFTVAGDGVCFEAQAVRVNHHEARARAKKVTAMVAVIDEQMLRQKRNPFDQAGLVVLASLGWIEGVWLVIAHKAGVSPPSDETKEAFRDVFRGRATAPIQRRAS